MRWQFIAPAKQITLSGAEGRPVHDGGPTARQRQKAVAVDAESTLNYVYGRVHKVPAPFLSQWSALMEGLLPNQITWFWTLNLGVEHLTKDRMERDV